MNLRAFHRILVVAGIGTALLGMYIGSQTSIEFNWESVVAIAVIAAGAYMTLVGAAMIVGFGNDPAVEAAEEEQKLLPDVSVPLLYGGFVGAIAVAAGVIVGHFEGRNAGFITFIFAFIVANLIFGIPLALARSAAARVRG
jgi:hypothetical protein